MLKLSRILDRPCTTRLCLALAAGAVVLAGCGQKGALYLPTGPASASRATLPETLRPAGTTSPPTPLPAASAPLR